MRLAEFWGTLVQFWGTQVQIVEVFQNCTNGYIDVGDSIIIPLLFALKS